MCIAQKEWESCNKIYESLDLACQQCRKTPADVQEKCKAEVNLTKAKMSAVQNLTLYFDSVLTPTNLRYE